MSAPSADRNLLFGLLALKMDLVSKDQLLAGMSAWLDRKADPLGLVLVEHGALSGDDREAIDRLVLRHLARHGDERRSLAALSVAADVRQQLEQSTDDAVRHSLSALGTPEGELATCDPVPPPPAAACRYTRLRPHARGGLGEVHVARDEELRREVALKEIQEQHADRADSRLRFVREAEITGALEHPGVVPIYGLGAYPDGRPFYAMRLIRGETLQAAIARFHFGAGQAAPGERELALRGLLGRFVAVCNAVAYAHSRGVIHRDLKPDNVMLGEYGETLVVDWGLAKLPAEAGEGTRADRPVAVTPSESGPTQMGRAIGTPAFMPPEQARGEHDKEGPRSDVFALGATLYALLTGSPPYTGPDAVARAGRGERARAREVNGQVPAALEAVCEKAMAAAPEARYGTARQLAADIERWLADEPVSAYRDPVSLRVGRWAKRHRTLVTSAVVLLAAGVVGLGAGLYAVGAEKARTEEALVATQEARDEADRRRAEEEKARGEAQRRRAEAERDRTRAEKAEGAARASLALAEKNLKLARRAVDETFGIAKDHPLFAKEAAGPATRALRKVLLEKALPFYSEFQVQRPDDPEAQLEHYRQHERLGDIHRLLGRRAEALKHYAEAERLLRPLVKQRGNDSAALNELANVLNNTAVVLSETLEQRRQARAYFNEAAALYRQALKLKPNDPVPEHHLANTLVNLAREHILDGQAATGLRAYEDAAASYRRLLKLKPKEHYHRLALATVLTNMGFVRYFARQFDEAAANYDEAIAICRAVLQEEPGLGPALDALAFVLFHQGNLLATRRRPEEALKSFGESARLFRALVASQPDVQQHTQRLVQLLINLANLEDDLGRGPAAIKTASEAVTHSRRLARGPSPTPFERFNLIDTLLNRAVMLSQQRRPKEAVDDLTEAIGLLLAERKRNPKGVVSAQRLGTAHIRRALALGELKRHKEALADWEQGVALMPQARAQLRPQIAITLAHAGEHDRAAAEASEMARLPRPSPTAMYNAACAFAVSAAAARADIRRPLPLRERLVEERSRQAVALLHRASQGGFFKPPANLAHLDKDADLDFLRPRDDYQRFRAALPAGKE